MNVGRPSVNTIQILSGLKEWDTVIFSGMSRWNKANQVPLEYEATSVLTNHGLPAVVDHVGGLVRDCRRRVVTENAGLPALIVDVLRLNRDVGL